MLSVSVASTALKITVERFVERGVPKRSNCCGSWHKPTTSLTAARHDDTDRAQLDPCRRSFRPHKAEMASRFDRFSGRPYSISTPFQAHHDWICGSDSAGKLL